MKNIIFSYIIFKMPKFEKGSAEAMEWAKRMKEARAMKKNDALVQAKKAERKGMLQEDIPLQKMVAEQEKMKVEDRNAKKAEKLSKEPKLNVDVFGTDTLILPEFFAVKTNKGYKLTNPLTQERHISTRTDISGKSTPFKILRKPVEKAVYLDRETGAIPVSHFVPEDRKKVLEIIKQIEEEKDKPLSEKTSIPFSKNKMRGRPEVLPANIEYNENKKLKEKRMERKQRKSKNIELVIEEPQVEETKVEEPQVEEIKVGKRKSKYGSEEERKRILNQQKYESNLRRRREKETPLQTERRLKREAKKALKEKEK